MRMCFAVAFAALSFACRAAATDTTTVYSFCSQAQCKDGSAPQAPLTFAAIGTLYGTTSAGGTNGGGTVFSLNANNDGSWTRTTLYKFCRESGCPDGADPAGPVVVDKNGNLYGIALGGGTENGGVVFELSVTGKYRVLYSFPEATRPRPALTYVGQQFLEPYDGVTPLYGLEKSGGTVGQGAAFQLAPPTAGKKQWKFDTIYSFCTKERCTDGAAPSVLLALGIDGANLVGATENGGRKAAGTVFALSPSGKRWKEEVEHHFCTMQGCADGAHPNSLVIQSSDAVSGTTSAGGNTQCDGNGCGVLFYLSYDDGHQTSFGIGHTFCSETDCADGINPAGISIGNGGSLFGVTTSGGSTAYTEHGGGTLFEDYSGAFITEKQFCAEPDCADGANPLAPPMQVDFFGTMLGTTQSGGTNGQGGTIYALTP